jgi:acetyl-CoA carboxylase biotin carboxyl carrier protein
MNIKEIEDLIKFVAKSGVSEVELESKDFKITIKTPVKGKEQIMMQAPVYAPAPTQVIHAPQPAAPAAQPAANAAPSPAKADDTKYVTIKSPMIGTFYRSSSPDKPSFVNVGDEVKPGKVICIIEAMKLFNEIECEVSGKIVKVLVDNATPVEYDQPLYLVEPA